MSASLSGRGPGKREYDLTTPAGTARVDLALTGTPSALVVLGHSAGGDSHAPLLVAIRDALVAASYAVALVDQPYRVAGRRLPDRSALLDEAMLAVVDDLTRAARGLPLVVGGKSSGSRVGCRIARACGAIGVVALGFPLTPPRAPGRSRAAELDAGCPVLVVQGERDEFGNPNAIRGAAGGLPVVVHAIAGADHSFTARRADGRTTAECIEQATRIVTEWVTQLP